VGAERLRVVAFQLAKAADVGDASVVADRLPGLKAEFVRFRDAIREASNTGHT